MSSSPVAHSVDAEGIAWITLDDASARANLFNPAIFASFGRVLDQLEAMPVKAMVIVSGKERIFSAGADLQWLAVMPGAETAAIAAREGQALFSRIAAAKVPVVCAIHGACAGGGFELALACTWRMASDAPETRIGLPEAGLGLIPGWGGCTRLARLIGAEPAAGFILRATLVSAGPARELGLIDELVPAGELKARAKAAAMRFASEGGPKRSIPPGVAADFFAIRRAAAAARWPGQPARVAVLDVVEEGLGLPPASALEIEATAFGKLAAGEEAKNLIRAFGLREKARKTTLDGWFPPAETPAPSAGFRTIGIVGAGSMGSGIAHWCAAHDYGVILCDSNRAAIEKGVGVIRALFADGVARGKVSADSAHRMTGGIGITTSLEDFEYCDLIIEAVAEDLAEKKKVFAELAGLIKPECIVVSTSSALPIEELAAGMPDPQRVLGMHFFNPVSRMPLLEIALGSQTGRVAAGRVLALARAMGKTPVISRSSPGHFVARVFFTYLNEACRIRDEGVAIEVIDEAMVGAGWPMGPMRVLDEIGIDVAAAVFAELAGYFPDRFAASTLCRRMAAAGLRGRKNGAGTGFYHYAEDSPRPRPNPAMAQFAPVEGGSHRSAAWEIHDRLRHVLEEEARRALGEGVVRTAEDAEIALILGAAFPAHRGPLFRGGAKTGAAD